MTSDLGKELLAQEEVARIAIHLVSRWFCVTPSLSASDIDQESYNV